MRERYHQLLHRYWGYDSFRPLQEDIVDAVVQGHDVLALLPTGGGKSLCYQLPALLREGVCLVVSPLIALMKDQVEQLRGRGLKAACLVSGMSSNEVTTVLYNAIAGEVKYLYVSPERLHQRRFIEHLRRMKVALVAVDEAHCVSQWGYDFRPPYLQVAEVRDYHPEAPMIALTATATPAVVNDICLRLKLRDPRRFTASFFRKNLTYRVHYGSDKIRWLVDYISRHEGSGIVYVRNRRLTQTTAELLSTHGIAAVNYHAGLDAKERDHRQALWMQGGCRVMVATNAFGMGIDKPDVRFVVHLAPPDSLEAYFQEAGRAGRDGQPAEAVLLFEEADALHLRQEQTSDYPPVTYIRNAYRALCNYYRLPIGSGADTSHDFELEEICNNYNLQPRMFYSACRTLERAGLISLPEREDLYSTLFIPLGRDELYRFQVEHFAMGNLLQALIRLYPGLFTVATPIEERRVAKSCMLETKEVVELLNQMQAMRVVEYRQRSSKPQIIFVSSRMAERDLLFSDQEQQLLREAAARRLEAMLDYVQNHRVCRSRQLLAYFGEVGAEDCGGCDVCRNDAALPPLEEAVRQALSQRKMSVAELCAWLDEKGYREATEEVRLLLDRGKIQMDPNLLLSSL